MINEFCFRLAWLKMIDFEIEIFSKERPQYFGFPNVSYSSLCTHVSQSSSFYLHRVKIQKIRPFLFYCFPAFLATPSSFLVLLLISLFFFCLPSSDSYHRLHSFLRKKVMSCFKGETSLKE